MMLGVHGGFVDRALRVILIQMTVGYGRPPVARPYW
jgi:hypothetical protein